MSDTSADESSGPSSPESESEDDGAPFERWVRVCRPLRAVLGRGQGDFHLGVAFTTCGIRGRPKIGVPGGTRMVVFSGDFLSQSFAHFPAQYRAVWAHGEFVKALSEDPWNKSRRRHRKLRRVGAMLADGGSYGQALLAHLCLSLPRGFVAGAKEAQTIASAFFPVKSSSRRVWWELKHLAMMPSGLARLAMPLCRPCRVAGPHSGRRHLCKLLRCTVCGFVGAGGATYLNHVKQCHATRTGTLRRPGLTEAQLLNAAEILRAEPPAAAWEVQFPSAVGVAVEKPDLLHIRAPARRCHFQPVGVGGVCADVGSVVAICRLRGQCGAPSPPYFELLLPFARGGVREQVWLAFRPFWSFICAYVASGRWRGSSLEAFREPMPVTQTTLTTQHRDRVAVLKACASLLSAIRVVRTFVLGLSAAFEEQVIHSNGDHTL